jgi:hypothetical protein
MENGGGNHYMTFRYRLQGQLTGQRPASTGTLAVDGSMTAFTSLT